jgi:hypothetical protein
MRIFAYLGISFLIVSMLSVGTKALSVDTASMVVADMVQIVAPDTTQSQNQTDSVLERYLAEEDLLNTLD